MKFKYIIGVCVVLAGITLLFSWEKWGREKFLYKDVAVLTENMEQGEVIDLKKLERKGYEMPNKGVVLWSDRNKLKGRVATKLYRKGEPLYLDDFQLEKNIVDSSRNRFLISLGKEHFFNMPTEIKRGKHLNFYIDGIFLMTITSLGFDKDKNSALLIVSNEQAKKLSEAIEMGKRFLITTD